MGSVTYSSNFFESIDFLAREVSKNSRLESAWLTALGHMEDLASKQILENISASTPKDFHDEIKAHSKDEERHRDMIWEVRAHQEAESEKERNLRATLMSIGESFVTGYFSNPLLRKAKSRFHAYVHGALTIEQAPFQIYSSYIKSTRSGKIQGVLKRIIADEHSHIQLGKKFLGTLPEADRLSLNELNSIERSMCHKMIVRMHQVVRAYLGEGSEDSELLPSDRLVQKLSDDRALTCFWVHALGNAERVAASHMQRIFKRRKLPLPDEMIEHISDEERHAKQLQLTVLLDRRKYRQQEKYRDLELKMIHALEMYLLSFFSGIMKKYTDPHQLYLYGALGLEMRVFKHYTDLSKTTNSIHVAHSIESILADEAQHTQMVNSKLRIRNLIDPADIKWVRSIEEESFEAAALSILEYTEHFGVKACADKKLSVEAAGQV
jgi:rubrerythrin